MSSQADFIQPPRIANWLVNLFAAGKEAESILGDMLEEFSQLVSKTGVAFARRWYWRQTRKTIAHLFGNAFRVAPWLVLATVIGGFLLMRLAFGLSERAIFCRPRSIPCFRPPFQRLPVLCDVRDCDRPGH